MAAAAAPVSIVQKSSRRPGINDMAKIRECFNAYDTNRDGVISKAEFGELLAQMGCKMSQAGVDQFFEQIDVDKSGTIEFSEFVDWYTTLMELADKEAQQLLARLGQETTFTRNELEAIYENYKRVSASVVNDGKIDQHEFRQMLAAGGVPSWNAFLCDGLFKMCDIDGSGNISFEEFAHMLAVLHDKKRNGLPDERNRLLFHIYDVDKDGKISVKDLASILSDCLQSNNIQLDEVNLEKLVRATMARAGCTDAMDLAAFLKEMAIRKL
jgi:Ca2+-binding EF-hand superfamily protein